MLIFYKTQNNYLSLCLNFIYVILLHTGVKTKKSKEEIKRSSYLL